MGFHAMVRFGAFCQLNAQSLSFVLANGQPWSLAAAQPRNLPFLRNRLLGIIFRFSPKYTSAHQWGAAFFCHVCVVAPSLKTHCPVCIVLRIWRRGLFRTPGHLLFDPKFF